MGTEPWGRTQYPAALLEIVMEALLKCRRCGKVMAETFTTPPIQCPWCTFESVTVGAGIDIRLKTWYVLGRRNLDTDFDPAPAVKPAIERSYDLDITGVDEDGVPVPLGIPPVQVPSAPNWSMNGTPGKVYILWWERSMNQGTLQSLRQTLSDAGAKVGCTFVLIAGVPVPDSWKEIGLDQLASVAEQSKKESEYGDKPGFTDSPRRKIRIEEEGTPEGNLTVGGEEKETDVLQNPPGGNPSSPTDRPVESTGRDKGSGLGTDSAGCDEGKEKENRQGLQVTEAGSDSGKEKSVQGGEKEDRQSPEVTVEIGKTRGTREDIVREFVKQDDLNFRVFGGGDG